MSGQEPKRRRPNPMGERREKRKLPPRQEQSLGERAKRKSLAFFASVRERLQYVKAAMFGQVKFMKARNEKEAAEAELQTSKMQVDAANEAERTKQQLGEEGF
ncbi:hypothetical protein EJ110_NYTH48803 [Nymphaea thermarum]|nr:hypothetical protein EJ110_NYTH48803 [Nymphaea thermarum]